LKQSIARVGPILSFQVTLGTFTGWVVPMARYGTYMLWVGPKTVVS